MGSRLRLPSTAGSTTTAFDIADRRQRGLHDKIGLMTARLFRCDIRRHGLTRLVFFWADFVPRATEWNEIGFARWMGA